MYVELLVAGGGLSALTTTPLGGTLLRSTTDIISAAFLDAYVPGGAEPSVNRSALWASIRTITEYNTTSSVRDLAARFTKSGVVNTTGVTGAGTQTAQWNAARRRRLAGADSVSDASGETMMGGPVGVEDAAALQRVRDLQSITASAANLTRIVLYVVPPPSALATAGVLLGDVGTVVALVGSSVSAWASRPDGAFLSAWARSTGVSNAVVLLGAVGAAVIVPPPPPPPPPPYPVALVVGSVLGSFAGCALVTVGLMILASAARRAYREDKELRGAQRAAHDAIVGRPQHSRHADDLAAQARSAATLGCGVVAAALATGGDFLFPRASAACFRVCFGGHREKPPAPTANHDIYADDDGSAFANPVLDHASLRFHEATADELQKAAATADVPHLPLGPKFSALLIRHAPHKAPPGLAIPPPADPTSLRRASSAQQVETEDFDLTPAADQDATGASDFANPMSPTEGAVAAVRRGFAAATIDSLAHARASTANDFSPSPPPVSPPPRVPVVRFSAAHARAAPSVDIDDNVIDTGFHRPSPRTSEGGRQLRFAAPAARASPHSPGMGSLPDSSPRPSNGMRPTTLGSPR